MSEQATVHVAVNGVHHEATVPVRLTLADFLRDTLRLTGTHLGCEHGVCGACTVIVDGAAVRSCLMFAVQVDGLVVETVESLATASGDVSVRAPGTDVSARAPGTPADVDLNPLQAAMSRHHALQCGFCTSGFLMTATAALRDGPIRDEAHAREVLSGNICRCTGYAGLVKALLDASGVDGGNIVNGGNVAQPQTAERSAR